MRCQIGYYNKQLHRKSDIRANISQIKNMIINNTLKEGDTLPSMRLLAKELRISVITTNVPMKSLSVTALLKQSQGKEVLLLKKNTQLILESQLQIIEEYIQKAINVAKNTEIDIDKLHKMLDLLYSEQ